MRFHTGVCWPGLPRLKLWWLPGWWILVLRCWVLSQQVLGNVRLRGLWAACRWARGSAHIMLCFSFLSSSVPVTPLPTLTRPSSPLSTTLSLFTEASKDIDRPKEAGLFFFPLIFFWKGRAPFPPPFSVRLFLHHATGTGADSNSNPHVNQATLSLFFNLFSAAFSFFIFLFFFSISSSLSACPYIKNVEGDVKQTKNILFVSFSCLSTFSNF